MTRQTDAQEAPDQTDPGDRSEAEAPRRSLLDLPPPVWPPLTKAIFELLGKTREEIEAMRAVGTEFPEEIEAALRDTPGACWDPDGRFCGLHTEPIELGTDPGEEATAHVDPVLAEHENRDHDAVKAMYTSGESFLHMVRQSTQPEMLRVALSTEAKMLVEELLADMGLQGMAARLVAEQAAEARADEAFYRAMAGRTLEGDDGQRIRGKEWQRMADAASRRMLKALDSLRLMRRPKVNMRVSQVHNLNTGEQQIVNQTVDRSRAEAASAPPVGDGRPG